MYVINEHYSALAEMVEQWFQPAPPSQGGVRKQEQDSARWEGRRDGYARSIAALLSEKRMDKYNMYDKWPMVDSWDVVSVLREIGKDWPASTRSENEQLIDRALTALNELMLGDDKWREDYELNRRSLIEKGELDPKFMSEADRQYFLDKAEASAAQSDRLKKLAGIDD